MKALLQFYALLAGSYAAALVTNVSAEGRTFRDVAHMTNGHPWHRKLHVHSLRGAVKKTFKD